MSFHPSYASNGFFYVDYTDLNGDTRVVRYSVSAASPDVADPASAKLILTVNQPFPNHNGGLVMFGPDGKLYVGLGDGGSEGDPQHNGQKLTTLLGKLLRIDVDAGDPYAIPGDNPFATTGVPCGAGGTGSGPCQEIWALGLRNPWRFSFDVATNRLYIADVGQGSWEEVDIEDASVPRLNYGWSIMEGMHCFGSSNCDQTGLTLPKLEYGHDQGCSITGGYVYRGSQIPSIVGRYFYSDFCTGFLRSFTFDGSTVSEQMQWQVGDLGNVLSLGQDAAGELYILSGNGNVYRLAAAP
jgi:glucose/arabinose dehydrogenase